MRMSPVANGKYGTVLLVRQYGSLDSGSEGLKNLPTTQRVGGSANIADPKTNMRARQAANVRIQFMTEKAIFPADTL